MEFATGNQDFDRSYKLDGPVVNIVCCVLSAKVSEASCAHRRQGLLCSFMNVEGAAGRKPATPTLAYVRFALFVSHYLESGSEY